MHETTCFADRHVACTLLCNTSVRTICINYVNYTWCLPCGDRQSADVALTLGSCRAAAAAANADTNKAAPASQSQRVLCVLRADAAWITTEAQ